MDDHDASDRFDLERVMAIGRRRWRLVVLCAVAGAFAAFVFSAAQQKQYTATAWLLLRDDGLEQAILPTAVYTQTVDPTREAETNIHLVSSAAVANRTASALHTTSDTVTSEVAVGAEGATNLVSVNATDPDPRLAATLANTYAAEAIAFRQRTDQAQVIQTQRGAQSQLDAMTPAELASADGQLLESRNQALKALAATATGNIQLVQAAGVPSAPSSPRTKRNAALGLLFGLLLGMAAAALAERLDRRVREPHELADIYGLPILARIPRIRALRAGEDEDAPALQENERRAFRMLLTRLRLTTGEPVIPAVVVTSAGAHEGKSTVAWHLAETAALTGQRVLLVQADRMHALVTARHGLRAAPGLGDVLAERSPVNEAIQPVSLDGRRMAALSDERATTRMSVNGHSNRELMTVRQARGRRRQPSGPEARRVDVMVGGRPVQDPTSLIESDRMTELLLTMAQNYDFIVFDSGSALLDHDAISLMKTVGGALVVGRLGVTSRDEAEVFRDDIRLLNVPLLGVVVNEAEPSFRSRSVLSNWSAAFNLAAPRSRHTERPPTCQGYTKRGHPCRANAVHGAKHCMAHLSDAEKAKLGKKSLTRSDHPHAGATNE